MYAPGKAYALDSLRAVTMLVHFDATPLAVMTGATTASIDVTRFVSSAKQSHNEATVTLSFHGEMYGGNQPKAGCILEIALEGESYWIGIVQSVDYRLRSGERTLSFTARSRDGTPALRDTRRSTQVYPTATPLAFIATQVVQACGLSEAEIALPDTGTYTVHSNTQLADLTPWQMLTQLYQPSGLEPYVDARGKLKCISRETANRLSDIALEDNRRLVSINGSKSLPPLTEMRIRWMDPELTEVAQQDRVLDRAGVTAGFFQLKQQRDVYFGADHTQRARDTHLVIKQSANSGLLPVCSEGYEQLSTTMGRITLNTHAWVPLLATAAMATKLAAHSEPDIAPPFGGPTVPVGRLLEFAADAVIMLTMMSIGTGQYEVWGTPYDYVHARNTTTAFNRDAKVFEIKPQEIENDFTMNAQQAQAFAVRELVYNHRSAAQCNLTIFDDTRIERGDLIELADGARVYVTGYSRDLSHGAPALLDIQGFLAPASGALVGAPTVLTTTPVDTPTPPPPAPPDPPPDPVMLETRPRDEIIVPSVGPVQANSWRISFKNNRLVDANPGNIQLQEWALPGAVAVLPADAPPELRHMPVLPTGTASSNAGANVWRAFGWPDAAGITSTGTQEATTLDFTFSADTPPFLCDVHTLSYGGEAPAKRFDIEYFDPAAGTFRTQQVICKQTPLEIPGITWSPFTYWLRTSGLNYYRWYLRTFDIEKHIEDAGGATFLLQTVSLELYRSFGAPNAAYDDTAVGQWEADGVFSGVPGAGTLYKTRPSSNSPQPWFRFQFCTSATIVEYGVLVPGAGGPIKIGDWTFEVSPDGVHWTVLDSRVDEFVTPGEFTRFKLPAMPVAG
jgi:hypothetical protein